MDGIRTLLFDADGTVLDARNFIIEATIYALKKHGYSVPERSVIASHVGESFDIYYRVLSGSDNVKPLQESHREFQMANFNLSKAYPHAQEVLKALKSKHFKLGLVSTRVRKTLEETLRQAGLYDIFDVVIAGDEAPIKPAPDALLKALDLLGEIPGDAVMIGDSHIDIEAGKNAGTKTIRAKYGFHADRLHEPEPDLFIEDIRDLLKIF